MGRETSKPVQLYGIQGFNNWRPDINNHDYPKAIHYVGDPEEKFSGVLPFPPITTILKLTLHEPNFRCMPDFTAIGETVRHLTLKGFQTDIDDLIPFLYCFTRLEYLQIDGFTAGHISKSARPDVRGKYLSLREVHLLWVYHKSGSDRWRVRHELSLFLKSSKATLKIIEIHGSWGPFRLTSMDNLLDVILDSFSVVDATETLNTLQLSRDPEQRPAALHVAFPWKSRLPDGDWGGFEEALISIHRGRNRLPLKFWLGVTKHCDRWVKAQFQESGVLWFEAVQRWTEWKLPRFTKRENVTIDLV